MRDDLFEEEIESGSLCPNSHPMFLVAEGYAICYGTSPWNKWVSAWKMGTPLTTGWNSAFAQTTGWWCGEASNEYWTRDEAIDFIRADIEAHRNLPFDEAAERARLVAV